MGTLLTGPGVDGGLVFRLEPKPTLLFHLLHSVYTVMYGSSLLSLTQK